MRRPAAVAFLLLSLVALAACGDGGTTQSTETTGSTTPTTSQAGTNTASTTGQTGATTPAPGPDGPVRATENEAPDPSLYGPGVLEIRKFNDYYLAVRIDERQVPNPAQFETIAKAICGDMGLCQVGIWGDTGVFPLAFPIPSAVSAAQAFNYGQDLRLTPPRTNSHWNCDFYPQYEIQVPRACLPRQLVR